MDHSGGAAQSFECVARLAPASDAMPIFPEYRMRDQFSVMALVGERTAVPVPRTLWYESDPEILGAEFFVMERVEGLVPPDILPYTFGGNWLTGSHRRTAADPAGFDVAALARIHAIPATAEEITFLGDLTADGDTALRAHVDGWRAYNGGPRRGSRSPSWKDVRLARRALAGQPWTPRS